MVPKLHAKGSSFKGVAAYVLHDKGRAESADRVGFTETRNLAVNDPDLAWRIMAATAMDQGRLKAEAGVKNTGRKSDKHVLHLTLNWHPDQKPSREDMLEAADGALKSLGASKHQALIVQHTDEAHPHLHLVVNRVSPIDGRHLSSSKEKLKLSAWAQGYEEKTGIVCENRVVNNAQRQRGEYVRGRKDQSRHIFEAQRASFANDNDRSAGVRAEQKAKDHALALRGRNLAKQHAGQWDRIEQDHGERKAAAGRALARQKEKARIAVIERMRPAWLKLESDQLKERETFEAMESSFFGRAGNILKTARLSATMLKDQESNVIRRTFGILTSAGQRHTFFEKAQERARMALERDQSRKVDEAQKHLKTSYSENMARLRANFLKERDALQERQSLQQAELKAAWTKRTAERAKAFELAGRKIDQTAALLSKYDRASMRGPGFGDPRSKHRVAFDDARRSPAREQDNDRDDDMSR